MQPGEAQASVHEATKYVLGTWVGYTHGSQAHHTLQLNNRGAWWEMNIQALAALHTLSMQYKITWTCA